MATTSFTGEYPQRIDGKGRMSIPADFRRVLDLGDPDRKTEGPSLYLLYGEHLKDHLEAWTVQAFDAMAATIARARPTTPEGRRNQKISQRLLLGQSIKIEVDRDGRVVVPARQRAKLGLSEGEVMFTGAGDSFEIWAAATFDQTVGADMRAFLDAQDEDFDPMALVWGLAE